MSINDAVDPSDQSGCDPGPHPLSHRSARPEQVHDRGQLIRQPRTQSHQRLAQGVPRVQGRPDIRLISEIGDREPPPIERAQPDVDPEFELGLRETEVLYCQTPSRSASSCRYGFLPAARLRAALRLLGAALAAWSLITHRCISVTLEVDSVILMPPAV